MGRQGKKKKVNITTDQQAVVDRISILPDELIHHIFSFLDARLVVRTSVLSKRWKLIWTTLPFLVFDWYDQRFYKKDNFYKFLDHVFTHRNHNSNLSKLKLHVRWDATPSFGERSVVLISIKKYVKYAISHNVEELNVSCKFAEFSVFNSVTLKNLKLAMNFDSDDIQNLQSWDLPALTNLHLKSHNDMKTCELPESCLNCLPALTTLCFENIRVPVTFGCSSLPAVTSLRLVRCNFPKEPCDFPSVLSLELADVKSSKNMTGFLSALVNLQSLTLHITYCEIKNCVISCPQLVNLKIGVCMSCVDYNTDEIVVIAPKLKNYWSRGVFPITFEGGLKNVNVYVKLWETIEYKHYASENKLMEYFLRLMLMFPGLGSAMSLAVDLDTIEALSEISNFLVDFPSPFHNLKYVKLPTRYNEQRLTTTIRNYLLGGAPQATFVTTLPQENMIPPTASLSLRPQNVPLEEPLENQTKELGKSQEIHKKARVESMEMSVQEEHVVGYSDVDTSRAKQSSSPVQRFCGQMLDANVAGEDNHQANSSRGYRPSGIWQGHEVNPEFVDLLNVIMKKYPETFEYFTTKSKKFCTMELNTLCTSVNAFTRTSLVDVDTEMINEYRALFADLQRSFNIEWLVSHLDYIEQLRFSNVLLYQVHAIDARIDDAKREIQDLKTLRKKKMAKIQNAFGTKDNNIAVGCIGGDLLYGP